MKRLKAAKTDCYLIRYSDNQQRYIVSVIKRGLGEGRNHDLIREFEIMIVNEGKKCKINGQKNTFKSLNEMLSYYSTVALHPTVTSLGNCCLSPRHKEKANRLTPSQISEISHADAKETLKHFQKREEQYEKRIEDMRNRLQVLEEDQSHCTIL